MEKKDIPFNLYIGQPVKVWLEDENGKFTIEREGTLSWNHEEGHEWVIYHLLSTDPLDFDGWDFRFKLLLRPLSSMTEEEFQEFAKSFFKDDKLTFATHEKVWYACSRELDPEFEGEPIEYINEACDADPENVIMCDTRSKLVTYGWIEYDERYHGFAAYEQAELFLFLLSKGFDLFGLIGSGLAIDSTLKPV